MRTSSPHRSLFTWLVLLPLAGAVMPRISGSEEVQRALQQFGNALGGMLAQQQAFNQAIAQGDAAAQQGNYPAAKASYQQAVQMNPGAAIGHARLAYVAQLEGDLRTAASLYEKAAGLAPRDATVHDALGQVYYLQGQYLAAIPRHQRAAELNRRVATYQHNLGTALAQSGQADAAQRAFEAALAIDRRFHLSHLWLAHLAKQRGDYPAMIAQIEKAREIAPSDASIYDALGSAYFEQGKFAESIPHYRRAATLFSAAPQYHNNLGAALVRLGQHEEALAPLREAARLNASYGLPHGWLATALRALGREAEAFAAADQYLKLQPDVPANDTVLALHTELKAKLAPAAPQPLVASKPAVTSPGATGAATEGAATAGPTTFNGAWETDFGALTLTQTGSRVKGTFTNPAGAIDGIVVGNVLRFTWQQPGTRKSGSGRFTLAGDGTAFLGRWNSSDDPDAAAEGTWHGTRTGGGPTGAVASGTAAPPPPRATAPKPAVFGRPEAVIAAAQRAGESPPTTNATTTHEPIAGGELSIPRSAFWQVAVRSENALTLVAVEAPDCGVSLEWERTGASPSAEQELARLAAQHAGVERLRDMRAGRETADCFAWAEGEDDTRREFFHARCLVQGGTLVRMTASAPAAVWQQHAQSIFALVQLEVRNAPDGTATVATTPAAGGSTPVEPRSTPLEVCTVVQRGSPAARAYRMQKVPIADGALVIQHDGFWQVADAGGTYALLSAPNSPDLSVALDWEPAGTAAGAGIEALAQQRREKLRTQFARVEALKNRALAGSPAAQTAWLTSADGAPQEMLEVECLTAGMRMRATISAPPAVWKRDGGQVLRLLEEIAAGG